MAHEIPERASCVKCPGIQHKQAFLDLCFVELAALAAFRCFRRYLSSCIPSYRAELKTTRHSLRIPKSYHYHSAKCVRLCNVGARKVHAFTGGVATTLLLQAPSMYVCAAFMLKFEHYLGFLGLGHSKPSIPGLLADLPSRHILPSPYPGSRPHETTNCPSNVEDRPSPEV